MKDTLYLITFIYNINRLDLLLIEEKRCLWKFDSKDRIASLLFLPESKMKLGKIYRIQLC